jgi:hypothetical protein
VPAWDALVQRVPPRLAARAEPQLAASNVCEIAATAGYRRLENQLYRVEIHDGGATPTFKWSRENGSVAYAVASVSVNDAQQETTVRVAARGRDANLDLAVGDRVELVDDDSELINRAGTFYEYLRDGDDELELVLAGAPQGGVGLDAARHPILRRWDHKPSVPGENLLPIVEDVWTDLEDGVQVRFVAGDAYRPGDYWLIPARSITSDVEWPRDDDGEPLERSPLGVVDAYCRLGIVEVAPDGRVSVISDCRDIFPPLTALEQMLYVSGDGQQAPPGSLLPQPLSVRVTRGSVPIAGRGVRFEVESGGGVVAAASGPSAWLVETTTDADGLAECRWTLGPAATAPSRFQRVRTSLLDREDRALPGHAIVFCATASLSLTYVSGDGQQGSPGAELPHALEMRVSDAADGVAGAQLRATVEQGGGATIGSAPVTDATGHAAIRWRLGAAGSQRLRVELLDEQGQVVQRLGYNATALAPVTTRSGCDVTIGRGGDFDRLTTEVLDRLLEEGRGSACVCFLPGQHEVRRIESRGGGRARLSLHGCGRGSVIRLPDIVSLGDFAALELRDLVLMAEGEAGLSLERNRDLRISNLELDRSRNRARNAALRVAGVERLVMTDCEIGAMMPDMAAMFDAVASECRVARNRFDGIVSFYGDAEGPASPDVLGRLVARVGNGPPVVPDTSQLTFSDNRVSLVTVGNTIVDQLMANTPPRVFASAVLDGNSIAEASNLFVAALLAFSDNMFIARPQDAAGTYGVMVADRATASGNAAVVFDDAAILNFVVPDNLRFSGAANQIFLRP